jgi:hypothetical protein
VDELETLCFVHASRVDRESLLAASKIAKLLIGGIRNRPLQRMAQIGDLRYVQRFEMLRDSGSLRKSYFVA